MPTFTVTYHASGFGYKEDVEAETLEEAEARAFVRLEAPQIRITAGEHGERVLVILTAQVGAVQVEPKALPRVPLLPEQTLRPKPAPGAPARPWTSAEAPRPAPRAGDARGSRESRPAGPETGGRGNKGSFGRADDRSDRSGRPDRSERPRRGDGSGPRGGSGGPRGSGKPRP